MYASTMQSYRNEYLQNFTMLNLELFKATNYRWELLIDLVHINYFLKSQKVIKYPKMPCGNHSLLTKKLLNTETYRT